MSVGQTVRGEKRAEEAGAQGGRGGRVRYSGSDTRESIDTEAIVTSVR